VSKNTILIVFFILFVIFIFYKPFLRNPVCQITLTTQMMKTFLALFLLRDMFELAVTSCTLMSSLNQQEQKHFWEIDEMLVADKREVPPPPRLGALLRRAMVMENLSDTRSNSARSETALEFDHYRQILISFGLRPLILELAILPAPFFLESKARGARGKQTFVSSILSYGTSITKTRSLAAAWEEAISSIATDQRSVVANGGTYEKGLFVVKRQHVTGRNVSGESQPQESIVLFRTFNVKMTVDRVTECNLVIDSLNKLIDSIAGTDPDEASVQKQCMILLCVPFRRPDYVGIFQPAGCFFSLAVADEEALSDLILRRLANSVSLSLSRGMLEEAYGEISKMNDRDVLGGFSHMVELPIDSVLAATREATDLLREVSSEISPEIVRSLEGAYRVGATVKQTITFAKKLHKAREDMGSSGIRMSASRHFDFQSGKGKTLFEEVERICLDTLQGLVYKNLDTKKYYCLDFEFEADYHTFFTISNPESSLLEMDIKWYADSFMVTVGELVKNAWKYGGFQIEQYTPPKNNLKLMVVSLESDSSHIFVVITNPKAENQPEGGTGMGHRLINDFNLCMGWPKIQIGINDERDHYLAKAVIGQINS